MRAPYWILAAGIVLLAWVILTLFIIYDTPRRHAEPVQISESYWHWLDETLPREDTAHYIIKYDGGTEND